jgi:hypothetical protein
MFFFLFYIFGFLCSSVHFCHVHPGRNNTTEGFTGSCPFFFLSAAAFLGRRSRQAHTRLNFVTSHLHVELPVLDASLSYVTPQTIHTQRKWAKRSV